MNKFDSRIKHGERSAIGGYWCSKLYCISQSIDIADSCKKCNNISVRLPDGQSLPEKRERKVRSPQGSVPANGRAG